MAALRDKKVSNRTEERKIGVKANKPGPRRKGARPAAMLVSSLLFLIAMQIYGFAQAPERIISLSPGTTEILFAAGIGDRVVGVTTFCDYPEEAKARAKIGGMSNPSLEAVVSLQPDVVVMTTDGNPAEFEQKLRELQVRTYVFRALTFEELPDGIRRMGEALRERERFERLAADIDRALDGFRQQQAARGKKVLFVVWPEPLIVAGARTAADDAIRLLGGVNIAGQTTGRYPKYSLEEIIRQSPDIIFIGKGEGMKKLATGLLERLAIVPAVKEKRVFYVGDHLFRLGPRVVGGVQELADYMNQEQGR